MITGESSKRIDMESQNESEERFFVLKPYVFAAHKVFQIILNAHSFFTMISTSLTPFLLLGPFAYFPFKTTPFIPFNTLTLLALSLILRPQTLLTL
jgi:hypothetical protein